MKKNYLLCLIILLFSQISYAQGQGNCPRDIVYNGSWSGGNGPNGAPNESDIARGIYIEGNVIITENVKCACLTIASEATLSIADGVSLQVENQLEMSGDLRLIGSSQLVQMHAGLSKVIGTGRLYKDQNSILGSTYEYSFWSSPVKNLNATTYTVAGVMKDGTTPLSSTSTHQNIRFTNSYNGTVDPLTISSQWLFGMLNGVSTVDWIQKREHGFLKPGEGYSMKGPGAPQNYTYVGTPNDGEITIDVIENTVSVLGNPYPSALDAHTFLTDNPIITDLYFLDQKDFDDTHGVTSYDPYRTLAVRNVITGVAAPSFVKGIGGLNGVSYQSPGRYIPIAQGFYTNVHTSGTIIFNNSHRSYYAEDDYDSIFINKNQNTSSNKNDETEFSVLKLGFESVNSANENIHRQTAISFIEGNSFAFESGIDSKVPILAATDMYFQFPNQNDKLVIAGIQEVTEGLEFPITVTIAGGTQNVELMVDEIRNIHHSFILIDKVSNIEYDIAKGPITLTLPTGTYSERFYIRFGKPNQEASLENDLIIYSHQKEVIIKPFNNTTIQGYSIHNVLGQKLLSSSNISTQPNEVIVRVPTTRFAMGVLFVRVETDRGVFTKKLILQ
jgi:hypothetical protein